MSRPDAIMFKGEYVATNLTDHEKDIWELGQVAGISYAMNSLRTKVEACIQNALEHYEASDHADWVTAVHAGRTSAFTDVLDLLDGPVSSKTIWKLPLAITDEQAFQLPMGSVPLSVQFQDDVLCLWAEIYDTDPKADLDLMKIAIYGTGNPMPGQVMQQFIGTVQEPDRPLVWHVYWVVD